LLAAYQQSIGSTSSIPSSTSSLVTKSATSSNQASSQINTVA
jgi:hypothetical protein